MYFYLKRFNAIYNEFYIYIFLSLMNTKETYINEKELLLLKQLSFSIKNDNNIEEIVI